MVEQTDSHYWQRVWKIFLDVLDVPGAERAALLTRLCRQDDAVRREVEALLHADAVAPWFETGVATARQEAAVEWAERSDALAFHAADRIGPWGLRSQLGSGGMGVVWLAERVDGQFEQRVALKLIRRGLDSEAVHRRFLRERQILARLTHPHIAHLVDGGIASDGSPYFAMEYVEGLPLLQYCNEPALDLAGRLRLFLDVCAAVQFAHEHQVVHRDLKPSNVLVTRSGDVKLLDFGIAKLLDADTPAEAITHLQREQPMTPAYAAPEQLRGGAITPATDVYALGCLLYELLTGEHAHDLHGAVAAPEVLRVIESGDPMPPSRRLAQEGGPIAPRQLRGNLDVIVLTALRLRPEQRYASVAALTADLQNHLAGRPIAARRAHLLQRGVAWARRHRAAAAALFGVLLSLCTALAVDWIERPSHLMPRAGAALAIVDFRDLLPSKDSAWVAAALTEMLASELAQGERMHALPDEVVRPARSDLAAPAAGGYAQPSLATLRKRLGVDFVLSGSYLVSGSGGDSRLRLDLALQDARSGVVVAKVAQSGALSDLPGLIEQTGASLREQAGYPRLPPDEARGTGRMRPPNTEVARAMGNALDALHKNDAARAKDELLDVVAIAPGYAQAYLYLAQAWKQLGYDAKALAAAQQADAQAAGLPDDLRRRIAREVAAQKADWPRAVELDRQSLAADARNPELHLALIDDLVAGGKWDEVDAALAALRQLAGAADDPRVDLRAANAAKGRGDPQAQQSFAAEALRKARTRDEQALAAMASFRLAQAIESLGRLDEAQALFRQLVDENQRLGNPRGEANAHVELAIILRNRGEPDAARAAYERALEIYQRIGDQHGRGLIYFNLMDMLWDAGDRDAAEIAGRHSLEIRREIGDLAGEGRVLNALAYFEMDEAVSPDVLDRLRQAIAVDERAGARGQRMSALLNYDEALRLRGDMQQARDVCAQIRREIAAITDPSLRMMGERQCAQVTLDSGDVAAATTALNSAAETAAAIGDLKSQASVAIALAELELAQRAYAPAATRLQYALGKANAAGDTAGEAYAQALLALSLQLQGKSSERDAALARARDLRTRITIRQQIFLIDLVLAKSRAHGTEREHAVALLLDLAKDAAQREWLAYAFEARLAAVQAMRAAPALPAAPAAAVSLQADAQQHGFHWVLLRLTPEH